MARSGVPQGSCSPERSRIVVSLGPRPPDSRALPGAPGRSWALSGASGVSRVGLRDGPLAHEGPQTAQGLPGRPSRRSKRAPNRRKIAPRRPRWSPDGPRGLQDAPRGLQEASQEGPKKQTSLCVHLVFEGFCGSRDLGFPTLQDRLRSPQDCPKTSQEAPKTAPKQPKRAPRQPKRPPRRPKRPPIRFQEGAQKGNKTDISDPRPQ